MGVPHCRNISSVSHPYMNLGGCWCHNGSCCHVAAFKCGKRKSGKYEEADNTHQEDAARAFFFCISSRNLVDLRSEGWIHYPSVDVARWRIIHHHTVAQLPKCAARWEQHVTHASRTLHGSLELYIYTIAQHLRVIFNEKNVSEAHVVVFDSTRREGGGGAHWFVACHGVGAKK